MLTAGQRKWELWIFDQQAQYAFRMKTFASIQRRRVQLQFAAVIVQQESRAKIGMQQARQLLHRKPQDFIQRGGRTGQAGDAPQGFGALGAFAGLLHQRGVFDDRRGLIGNDHQQVQLFLREDRAAVRMVGGLQITEHASAGGQRNQHRIAQAGALRQVVITQRDPLRVFHRVFGDEHILVEQRLLCRATGSHRRAVIGFDKLCRQPVKRTLPFKRASSFVIQQEAQNIDPQQRRRALHQFAEQTERFAHRTKRLRELGETRKLRRAALFFAVQQCIVNGGGCLPGDQLQHLLVFGGECVDRQRAQFQRADQFIPGLQRHAQVRAQRKSRAICRLAQICEFRHIRDEQGLSLARQVTGIALVPAVTLYGWFQPAAAARLPDDAVGNEIFAGRIPQRHFQQIRRQQLAHIIQDGVDRGFQIQAGTHILGNLRENLQRLRIHASLPPAKLREADGDHHDRLRLRVNRVRNRLGQPAVEHKTSLAFRRAQGQKFFARAHPPGQRFEVREIMRLQVKEFARSRVDLSHPAALLNDNHRFLVL